MTFRSWAEDYRPPEEPIDLTAFHWRRIQRGMVRSALARHGETGSGYQPNVYVHLARQDHADLSGHARRATVPVLRAQLHLQRRGWRVFRASTIDPRLSGWIVGRSTEPIDDEALIALATAKGMRIET